MGGHIDVELEEMPARPSSRRRGVVVGVGAAMLVAAAGGVGFGIGRGVDDGALSSPGGAEQTPVTESTEGSQVPTTAVESAAEDGSGGGPTVPPPADEPAVTTGTRSDASDPVAGDEADVMTDVADLSMVDDVVVGGGGWSMLGGSSDMVLLTERTTPSGVILRAHLAEVWDDQIWEGELVDVDVVDVEMRATPVDAWTPPAWCYESGQVRIALGGGEQTGPPVVDVGSVGWWREPYQGRAVSWVTLGRVDDNPHRVVFVQTSPEVVGVTVTFEDGAVDSAVPQNGFTVLAVPGEPESIVHEEGGARWVEERPRFRVDFETASGASTGDGEGGATVAPVVVDGSSGGMWDDPVVQESCSPPPPALPEPGEQPDDAEDAEARIVDVMSRLYGDGDGEEVVDALEVIDDPTGVAEARQEVAAGGFAEAAAAARAIVEELVFTTPTDAWFRYRIETTTGTFGDRFGQATLIAGVWKVSRDTICQDLSLAGGDCGGAFTTVMPPGAEGAS